MSCPDPLRSTALSHRGIVLLHPVDPQELLRLVLNIQPDDLTRGPAVAPSGSEDKQQETRDRLWQLEGKVRDVSGSLRALDVATIRHQVEESRAKAEEIANYSREISVVEVDGREVGRGPLARR